MVDYNWGFVTCDSWDDPPSSRVGQFDVFLLSWGFARAWMPNLAADSREMHFIFKNMTSLDTFQSL